MPDEQNTPTTPTIPDGMELITKEKFRQMAEFGNDLKKLKSQLADAGITDISATKELLASLTKTKEPPASSSDDAIERLRKTNADLKAERDLLKTKAHQTQVMNDLLMMRDTVLVTMRETIQAEGKAPYLSDAFIDVAKLYTLDPSLSTYTEDLTEILKAAWDRQEQEFSKYMPYGVQAVGGIPSVQVGGGMRSIHIPNMETRILSEMQGIGPKSFTGFRRPENTQQNVP